MHKKFEDEDDAKDAVSCNFRREKNDVACLAALI